MTRWRYLMLALVLMTTPPAAAAAPSPTKSGDLQVGGSKIHPVLAC